MVLIVNMISYIKCDISILPDVQMCARCLYVNKKPMEILYASIYLLGRPDDINRTNLKGYYKIFTQNQLEC